MTQLNIPSGINPPHNVSTVLQTGEILTKASAAVIMIHGRGATAEDILRLSQYFLFEGVSYIAPQANGFTWYPNSFLMPIDANEPGLSSALERLSDIIRYVISAGIPRERIVILGFSQGASLSLEWTARNAANIAAVFGLSGGLIGPPGTPRDYAGTLKGTTVFLGCSDVDIHIPKERVLESAEVFKRMNADVTMKLYPNLPHTVNDDEIYHINKFMQQLIRPQ